MSRSLSLFLSLHLIIPFSATGEQKLLFVGVGVYWLRPPVFRTLHTLETSNKSPVSAVHQCIKHEYSEWKEKLNLVFLLKLITASFQRFNSSSG